MAVDGVCMTFLIGVTKSDFREGFLAVTVGAGAAWQEWLSPHMWESEQTENSAGAHLVPSLSLTFAFLFSIWDPPVGW